MIPDGFTVVAGSLGDQGGAAARTLKRHGRHVRALTSNRSSSAARHLMDDGIDVLSDDLENPEVAVRDLAGAAHVFAAFTPFDEGGLNAELRQVRDRPGPRSRRRATLCLLLWAIPSRTERSRPTSSGASRASCSSSTCR